MRKIKKEAFIVLAAVLVAIIIIVVVIVNVTGGKEKTLSQQEKLEKLFTTMSTEYYEEFYYNQIGKTQEEKEAFLKRFKTTGIQINLDSLSRYNSLVNTERIEEFVNLETNEKCDLINTVSIIYPKKPYQKDSYEVKIKLDCGFAKEKK